MRDGVGFRWWSKYWERLVLLVSAVAEDGRERLWLDGVGGGGGGGKAPEVGWWRSTVVVVVLDAMMERDREGERD